MNSSCNTAAKIVDSAVAHLGTIDVLVNNTGIFIVKLCRRSFASH